MKALAIPVLAACAGCASFTWERASRYAPPPSGALASLEPGRTELDDCLAALGAPLWVWEDVAAGRPAAALAYGWYNAQDKGLRLSVPISEELSASFDYDQIDERMKGLVLFFDQDWKLVWWESGLLRDLTRQARRPPAALDEEDT